MGLFDKLRTATLTAAIAELPAVATAAGWHKDRQTGEVVLNRTREDEQLGENLETLSTITDVLMDPAAAYNLVATPLKAGWQTIRHPQQTYNTTKIIVKEIPDLAERAFGTASNTVYNWSNAVKEGLGKARSYYFDGNFSARAASKLDVPWTEADEFANFAVKHIDDTKIKVDPKLSQHDGVGAQATSSIDPTTGLSTVNVNPGARPNIYTVIHEAGGHGATLNYDPTNISGWGFTKQLAPTKETRRVLLKVMDNATKLGWELELKPEFKTWESTYKHYLDLGESEEYARKVANYLHKDPSYGQIGAIDGYYRTGQEGRSYWLGGRLWLIDHGIISLDEVYSHPEVLKLLSEVDQRFKLFTPESMKNNYRDMVELATPLIFGVGTLNSEKHGGTLNYLNYIN